MRAWDTICTLLNPAGRIEPSAPHHELRFTRAHQAVHFAVLAVVGLALFLGLCLLAWRPWGAAGGPLLRPWWLVLLPLPVVGAALWAMVWCATHAYILLSPAGVEVFPLLFPGRGFRLVPWGTIAGFRTDGRNVVLDLTGGGGVVLSLAPVRPSARPLLVTALRRRLGG